MMNNVGLVCVIFAVFVAIAQASGDCDQIFSTNLSASDKRALCKIYQTSAVLVELGVSVLSSVEKFLINQGHDVDLDSGKAEPRLNFQKRKHEYLRFGRK
ncbi:AF2 peptide [Aphelenchoides besseyi]|nr:AF2 peptide [Aphelenchoides besseyi]KAI6235396.1 AF2 peptide [Aphelenchoides besseyi]